MDRRQAVKTLALGVVALPLVHRGVLADAAPEPAAPATETPPAPPATPAAPFTLPPLGYAFDALEPHIDAQTMQIHHDKHHAAYVTNLNKAVAGHKEVEGWTVERLLRDLSKVPENIRTAVRNHGGGHANHSLFWASLKKDGAKRPGAELAKAIDAAFGSFSTCGDKLALAAAGVFGSGWAWLTTDRKGIVQIETSPNQDSPLTAGRVPLIGLDVWEHAYYLKYQNRRADYIAAFGEVIDWDVVSARYRDAMKA
jgi:Fe-Mn family superoxide dismutase